MRKRREEGRRGGTEGGGSEGERDGGDAGVVMCVEKTDMGCAGGRCGKKS